MPTDSDDVVKVALPPERLAVPNVAAPSRNVTVPVGVPTPGQERFAINLSYVRKSPAPPQRDVEVVIERFQYFP